MNRFLRTFVAITMLVVAAALPAQDESLPNPFGDTPLEPIPFPDLNVLQEAVRDSLQSARDYFEEESAAATSAEALGMAYGRLGMHYQAHELQDPAGAAYRNAITLMPDDARWLYYLALHSFETGNYAEAIQMYRRAGTLQPDYLPLQARLGLAYLENNQNSEARAVFEKVLSVETDHVAALAGMGRVAFRNKDYDSAIDYFERALAAQPQANELHYRLGMAYRQKGDVDKAREHLPQRGKVKPQFPDPLLRAMQGRSQSSQFYLQQGIAAGKEGNFEGAVNALTVAIAVNPKDDMAYVALGLALEQLGKLDEAGIHYEQALKINPENTEASFNIGVLLHRKGFLDPALEYYQQAVANNADYTEAWFLLGHANMHLSRYDEAAANFSEVARLQSDNVYVLHLRVLAHLAAGDCEQAMQILEQALSINPNRGDILQTQARTLATCPAASDEQKQVALADARALYELRPNLEHAETLAMVEAALGNYQDAADYQAQAMFESFKAGGPDRFPGLTENMERYRDGQPPVQAWASDHPVFRPDPFAEEPAPAPENAPDSPESS